VADELRPVGRAERHVRARSTGGVPVGPFIGRDAIAAAYREQPPDDEVEILGSEVREGVVVARYAWLRDEGRQAGEMRLTPRDGQIEKLVVTFG
jgi:steroid delta-isomerase